MVKGDGRYEVVYDMSADDVMKKMGVDESKVSVNGSSRSSSECPLGVAEMRQGSICVLKEGDRNCFLLDF